MTLIASPDEVKQLIALALTKYGFASFIPQLAFVSVEGEKIVFKRRLGILPLSASATLAAVEGAAELDIDVPLSPITRPLVARAILAKLAPFKDKVTAIKGKNGNLQFSHEGVELRRLLVAPGAILVEAAILTI